jgi:pimeloyl-ACP methyl ester carboxylesterase
VTHLRNSQLATSSDGEALRYQIDGPAAGEAGRAPMLTVHGLVSSVHQWQYFTPYFAATRNVVSWEYRGHGGQAPPRDRRVSVAQFADDAAAVCRAAGQGPSIVAGLSFGVQVALEMWRRHPPSVRALILLCGTPGHPLDRISSSPSLRATAIAALRWLGQHPALAAPGLRLLRTTAGQRVVRECAYLSGGAVRACCPREVLDGLFTHVAGLDPELVGNVVAAYLEHSAEDALASVTVPTMILAADRDQLTPVANAERMHRAISGSRLIVFPGHSHLVQVEASASVHAAIDAFLEEHRL